MSNNITWQCQTDQGDVLGGFTEDGSWRKLKNLVLSKKTKIVSLNIRNKYGGGTIDSNADGYFMANKILAKMGGETQEYIGIGYWKSDQDVVRIKWYNYKTMELFTTEVRNVDSCSEDCLIKNI